MARLATADHSFNETMSEISELGLDDYVAQLDNVGYTVVKRAITESQVDRARSTIVGVMEQKIGRKIDIDTEDSTDFQGLSLASYLLFENAVFEEIVQASKPLALIYCLLGRSVLLSSMTCHFKAPGGQPLALHSDNGNGIPAPYSMASQAANVNYALTEYSAENGSLAIVPGSHRLCRPPSGAETDLRVGTCNPDAVAMNLEPGDCVVWHGNTWHGSLVRQVPGIRLNLAVYFCRQYIVTQERFNEYVPKEFLERHSNNTRLLRMLGQTQPYGWSNEGPDWTKFAQMPRGLFD